MNLILGLLLFLLLASCTQQEQLWEKDESQATVRFTLSLPAESKARGNVSTYPKDPSQWTDDEKLADGRYFEYVTILILKGTALQAFEDLDVTDKNTQATVSFDHTFTTGAYTLMAVANYNGLSDFTALLSGFKSGTRTYNDLMAYKLQAGDDGVTPKNVMQPLTLIQEIDLHPGLNEISGEMLRTYARIRIEVRNQSETNDLTVNGIRFSNNFAQKEAYIWPGQGYVSNSRVAIDVDSEDALTPFSQPLTIPKIASSDGTTTVNSSVVFDGYILESEETDDEADYSYTLDLSYGETSGSSYTVQSTTAITNVNNLTEGYYLIYNSNQSRYLMAGNSTVGVGTSVNRTLGAEVSAAYVWELEKSGTNQYYIKNTNEQGTSYYIDNPTGTGSNSIPLVAAKDAYFNFTTNSEINMQASQRTSSSYYYYYIAIKRNGNNRYAGGNGSSDTSTRFNFYPINRKGLSKNEEIVLKTINKETAKVETVREIKRNDFINALVTVSYNEDIGTFEFEVEDWNEGGGDITFS